MPGREIIRKEIALNVTKLVSMALIDIEWVKGQREREKQMALNVPELHFIALIVVCLKKRAGNRVSWWTMFLLSSKFVKMKYTCRIQMGERVGTMCSKTKSLNPLLALYLCPFTHLISIIVIY